MIIRMNAVSPTEQIPYTLGLLQGVRCKGGVAEVLGRWWVQLGRHHKLRGFSCPFLPLPPTRQSVRLHRLTGSDKATQSSGTPAWTAADILYVVYEYVYVKVSRGPNGRNPNAVLKLRPDPSELSRTSPACEMTLCFGRRNATQMGKCQEPSGP